MQISLDKLAQGFAEWRPKQSDSPQEKIVWINLVMVIYKQLPVAEAQQFAIACGYDKIDERRHY